MTSAEATSRSASFGASSYFDGGDGIVVTDLPDELPGGLFGSVLGVYEQRGYEAGYRRAVQDVLVALLSVSEEFIRAQPGDGRELRRVVQTFEQHLRRRIGSADRRFDFVEGGLGI